MDEGAAGAKGLASLASFSAGLGVFSPK